MEKRAREITSNCSMLSLTDSELDSVGVVEDYSLSSLIRALSPIRVVDI